MVSVEFAFYSVEWDFTLACPVFPPLWHSWPNHFTLSQWKIAGKSPCRRMFRMHAIKNIKLIIALISICILAHQVNAQEIIPEIAGTWIINSELSDNTDKQVEAALKAAGEKIERKLFNNEKDRYRGGPVEQELYDHISYDQELNIVLSEPEFSFTYDDDFHRSVFTDNRNRSVSLNSIEELKDFSFAHWENNKLLVEARPRDGGFAEESYSLISAGTQLRVEFYIFPEAFRVPIELVRVYDRKIISFQGNN